MPAGRTIFCGSAGAGKTMFAVEFIVRGVTMRDIANIRRICEEHLQGRYELEVIDLLQRPALADGEQIIAAPTLWFFIGDLCKPTESYLGSICERYS